MTDFYKRRGSVDGHNHTCKHCFAKRRQAPLYKVLFCPCNSWTGDSQFTRNEVDEMLRGVDGESFLAIGTRFSHGLTEYVVNEDMRLEGVR